MNQHKEQLGFLTIAANSNTVNYLNLAYLQALNIKETQRNNKCAVIVDSSTAKLIEKKHQDTFDYIIESPNSQYGPFGIEHQVFWLTPFKETIKLESDLLFTRSIDHWIHAFRLRDVVLSTGCCSYLQEKSQSRKYRKVFDDNALPDVYNGLMYFRFSQTAANFFRKAKDVIENWSAVQELGLVNCREMYPTTDVVYGVTSAIIGEELCTIPSADFINFVHMKPAINGYSEELSFQEVFITEFDSGMIRVNNVNQYHPFHYHEKNFATEEIIEYYERRRRIT
jgi:hypothetical protein